MSTQPPNPSRFEVYNQLIDGSGFKIKGSDFVFKFDRYGGWFDEYANYYNADGQPEEPPSDSDSSQGNPSEGQYSYHSDEDEFEKQFGKPKDNDSDQEEHHDPHFIRAVTNISTINSYPAGRPFRINFRNIPYLSKREVVFNTYKAKVPGITNVIFLENQKRQFNGNGYFVVQDFKSGQALLRLQGDKYDGRDVRFSVPDAEELLLEPVEAEQLYPDFATKNGGKTYVTKAQRPKEAQKKEENKVIMNSAEKKVQIKPFYNSSVNVADPQQFVAYKFLKKSFPKKSSFKQWIQDNQFNHEKDIEKVQKIDGNEDYALVTMKRKVFTKLNGTLYNGVRVQFESQK